MSRGRRVLIDCDPGHDDAVAILLAARHLDVLAITTVGGNQSLDHVTRNALSVLALGGLAGVPVAAGYGEPMVGEARFAGDVHGRTGLDGADLPSPIAEPDPRHAVDLIIETARANPGLVLIPTGPLGNVAGAIRKDPELPARVSGISLMGGSHGPGNLTPAAEFNIGFDPEAADVVFRSGIPIKMSGLNLTRQAAAGDLEIERFRALGNRTGRVVGDLVEFYRDRSRLRTGNARVPLHDACAVAAVIDPSLIRFRPLHVAIELAGRYTRGMTVCDDRFVEGFRPEGVPVPNAEVGVAIDRERFFDLLYSSLAAYP